MQREGLRLENIIQIDILIIHELYTDDPTAYFKCLVSHVHQAENLSTAHERRYTSEQLLN